MSDERLQRLEQWLRDAGRVLVAYSGGVDSAFLARVAHDVLDADAVAFMALSPSHPAREVAQARGLAERIGIELVERESHELALPAYRNNAPDRCYHCKNEMFRVGREIAAERGIAWLLDGHNTDDTGDFRPGMRAAEERDVRHPLMELGFDKAEIRRVSKQLGLPTWDKPAMACLASRLPYGTPVTGERLARIEQVEGELVALGFGQFRARDHEPVLRLEIAPEEMDKLLDETLRQKVHQAGRAAGFQYVAVDLMGYRTGSLNEALDSDERTDHND